MNPAQPGSRVIGVVYLLYFLAAIGGALAARGLYVAGDPLATARGILAHASAFRAALALDLVGNVLYLVLMAMLVRLFDPVDRRLALVAAFLGVAGCVVQVGANVFRAFALSVLLPGGTAAAGGAGPEALHDAAMGLSLHALTYQSSFVLFGLFNVSIGMLIVRSTLLPRVLGALMIVAGLGWLTFLWPPLATSLAVVVMPLGMIAELVLMGWLLVRGTRVTSGA